MKYILKAENFCMIFLNEIFLFSNYNLNTFHFMFSGFWNPLLHLRREIVT